VTRWIPVTSSGGEAAAGSPKFDTALVAATGTLGIGVNLLVIGIAAFNLLLDFDLIERGVAARAPKYMEWYGAFALLVTLVWLYIEFRRLLSRLRRR
jgi:uncharacterized YccA/Bax inhibitor family protein